jgi:hypothetical protein
VLKEEHVNGVGPEEKSTCKDAGFSNNIKEANMNMTLSLAPIVSLIAGILILVVPRLLNYIVAIYLITIGLLGLLGANGVHL